MNYPMDSERSIIEGGSSAATCTCGGDLAGNGGLIHNYACPMTPKCQNPIPGGGICGSRLEPQYACHVIGCPCIPLCPHCSTPMDPRGVHSIGCPNYLDYSFSIRHNSHHFSNSSNFESFFSIFLVAMREMQMPVIPPAILVLHPSIIDGDFVINGQCCICHDECEPSQQVLKPSNCNHCFHENCLTPWIREHSTCPNCRGEIQTILRKN